MKGFRRQSNSTCIKILIDSTDNCVYSSKISLRVLYLNKLEEATEQEKQGDVYKWARLITAHDWEELKEMAKTNEYMNEAVEEMKKINSDKNMRYQYLMREKAASDAVTLRNYYTKKGIEQGMEIGIQALIQDNLEEGIPKEKIIEKLIKRFNLDQEKALHFYDQYGGQGLHGPQ